MMPLAVIKGTLYSCKIMLDDVTGSSNVYNMLWATTLQYVTLKCCVRLSRSLFSIFGK